jgi:hypothetical protein
MEHRGGGRCAGRANDMCTTHTHTFTANVPCCASAIMCGCRDDGVEQGFSQNRETLKPRASAHTSGARTLYARESPLLDCVLTSARELLGHWCHSDRSPCGLYVQRNPDAVDHTCICWMMGARLTPNQPHMEMQLNPLKAPFIANP